MGTLTNSMLAELLARAAAVEEERGHRRRALDGAAHAALRWPVAVSELVEQGRKLTELDAVGPWVAEKLDGFVAAGEEPDPSLTPPERRGFSSLAEARALLAASPGWSERLVGDLQMHSTWSDGQVSLAEMVAACERRGGYRYIAITDHTKGLRIAHGMDEARLAEQAKEVAAINKALVAKGAGLRLLHAVEMNLSPQGEGDMAPEALAPLDLVLGAFHSQLRVSEDQTARYVAGVRNPDIDVLGHPRTRMWDRRVGLNADWKRVFEAAAEAGTAVELDGHPNRQDLDVETLRIALETEVRFSIGSDAHHPDELVGVEIALANALRAGIPAARILPFCTVEELRAFRHRR
jgi:histidinol phosphatase-like PHP family hydrolase